MSTLRCGVRPELDAILKVSERNVYTKVIKPITVYVEDATRVAESDLQVVDSDMNEIDEILAG